MEREDKELIDHLAEKLKSHELPYEEGAWEQYMQYEQSRQFPAGAKRIWAPWLVAAASIVVLALGGVYFFQKQSSNDAITHDVTRTALAPTAPLDSNNRQNNLTEKSTNNTPLNPSVTERTNAHVHDNLNQQNLSEAPNYNQAITAMTPPAHLAAHPADNNEFNRFQSGDQEIVMVPNQPVITNATTTRQTSNLLSGIDRLLPGAKLGLNMTRSQQVPPTSLAKNRELADASNTAATNPAKPTNSSNDPALKTTASNTFDSNGYFDPDAPENAGNKWGLGVMVIPAMGNDSKLNLGYGVSVGYRLSNKVSVNSGVSYNELSGTRDEGSPSAIAAASGGRLLSSVDANVTGLSVPLELRYHVSQKIYVGAGVSALAVLSNKFERNYTVSEMQTSAFEAKNGHQLKPDEMKSIAANLTTKEDIPEAQIDSKNFAGFMNFTFGFQQKLNKTKSLSIEPYISVPMNNNLSNQNIRLTDGGIRIKLGL